MRRIIAILIPLAIIGTLIVWRLRQKQEADAALAAQREMRSKSATNVEVAPVALRTVTNSFEVMGSLEAPLSVKVTPKVTGRIEYLEVHEGDHVTRGQTLVRIDASQIDTEVRQQKAALAEAQFRLAQAEIAEAPVTANVRTQITQQMAAVAGAQADLDQVRDSAEAQIAAAEAGVLDAQGKVDNTEAAMANAAAAISGVEANLANSRTKLDRLTRLVQRGGVSLQEVDDLRTTVSLQEAGLEAARAQLRSATAARDSALAQRKASQEQVQIVRRRTQGDIEAARQKLVQTKAALEYARANSAQKPAYRKSIAALGASVENARAELASVENRRADNVISAPMDGYVTARYADPGSLATTGQPLLAIQAFRQVWVSFSVPDTIEDILHVGDTVVVRFDTMQDLTFAAEVVQMNPSADPQARQFTVRAALDNSDGQFKPGMFASVTIETARLDDAVTVPREAIQRDDKGTYVMVVANETASRRPVVTGLSDADHVSVKEGLTPGEQVVIVTSRPLKDGQAVRTGSGEEKGGREGPPGAGGSRGEGTGPPGAGGSSGGRSGPPGAGEGAGREAGRREAR